MTMTAPQTSVVIMKTGTQDGLTRSYRGVGGVYRPEDFVARPVSGGLPLPKRRFFMGRE